jgi:hypothetical protein
VDPAAPRIDSTFDFGLIEAGRQIRITAKNPAPPADNDPATTADETVMLINVLANTNIKAGGEFVDILTNGFIGTSARPVREIVAVDPADPNDLRVGKIESTADDVFLLAPHSILDAAPDDDATAAADVLGINITLTALTGSIGTAADFLKTNLIDRIGAGTRAGAKTGVLTADARLEIRIDEVADDLRVNTVLSRTGNVSLTTRDGSILDARTGTIPWRRATSPTFPRRPPNATATSGR